MEKVRWCRLLAGVIFVVLVSLPVAVLSQAGARWSPHGSMPYERGETAIAAANGKIYLISGSSRGVEANAFNQEYDPAQNGWSTAAPLITARSAGVVLVLDGRIVYAGGECKDPQASVTFSEVEAYDPRTDQWMALPALQPGRHAAAAVAMGDQAYLFGGNLGCGGNRPSKDVLIFRFRS